MKDEQSVRKKLQDLVSIRSLSADPTKRSEIQKAAEYIKTWLTETGFKVTLYEKGDAPPMIVATYSIENPASTIGIYAHYDVQAEDPVDEWHTPPFTVTEKNGKLWGRGVADDKGHIVQCIAAAAEAIELKELQNNLVFVFEGEEETGSYNLHEYLIQAAKHLSQCDFFIVADAGMKDPKTPMIEYGLRGLVYFELTVNSFGRDLHSGLYGNKVANPANVVASIIGAMKDPVTNEVCIPGFYDGVRELDSKERELLEKNTTTDEQIKQDIQGKYVRSMRGLPAFLVSKVLPSLDINGMIAGYTGEGPKTVIPRTATVKFSTRLVPDQTADRMEELIKTYIQNQMPKDVDFSLKVLSKDEPFYTDFRTKPVQQVAKILKDHFGNETIYNRSGGSIPVAEMFQRLFAKPVLITGFTLPDENLHAPNENIDAALFKEGITVLKKLFLHAFER